MTSRSARVPWRTPTAACAVWRNAAASGTRPSASLGLRRNRSARRPHAAQFLLRSKGNCENPDCIGHPDVLTDTGDPILEIDHIHDLAKDGPDDPIQMIALCPNCHAVKTRSRDREQLRQRLFEVARQRHQDLI